MMWSYQYFLSIISGVVKSSILYFTSILLVQFFTFAFSIKTVFSLSYIDVLQIAFFTKTGKVFLAHWLILGLLLLILKIKKSSLKTHFLCHGFTTGGIGFEILFLFSGFRKVRPKIFLYET